MKITCLHILFVIAFLCTHAQPPEMSYISVRQAARQLAPALQGRQFLLFPEIRERPMQWQDSLRPAWLRTDYSAALFPMHAQPGEYFVFQVGLWPVAQDAKGVRVTFSDLVNEAGEKIRRSELTCFNSGGIDFRGHPFSKIIDVPRWQLEPLWMGIDLPASAKGRYTGTITITANSSSRTVRIGLDVTGQLVADHGFGEARRLARLQWLNSRAGIDNGITKGFTPIQRNGHELKVLGRSMEIGSDGLPGKITSYFTPSNQSISAAGVPVLHAPFRFLILQEDGDTITLRPGKIRFTSQSPSFVTWETTATAAACDLICEGRMEYDGSVDYHLTVKAKTSLKLKDIALTTEMDKDRAKYMMGLNRPGGTCPESWDWKWDTARNQDDLWLGAVNGGLRIKWKAENYVLPLINVYYGYGRLHLPPSWSNNGAGGIHLSTNGNSVSVNAWSGPRSMRKGEEQHYDVELLITPFKTIDHKVQFGARYYQSDNNSSAGFIHAADSLGANIINVHQGNDSYPFINYPYSDANADVLKRGIADGQKDHKRVKVYYTTRELTVNLPELWPFLSLGGEVIYPGPGAASRTITNPEGPDPWLTEHLRGRKYIPAWVAHFTTGKYAGMQDLSVITTPDSRLNNFYVQGLDWMVRKMGIDGIYIDDCAMDRTTIRRVRKILDEHRRDANIDMHSWDHYTGSAGWASCMNLYMELFPYIDQLWIGEARNYNTPPDYWLVEISGLPFGLPGQMLQDGGNPWRGMVYGMTNRAGWTGPSPRPIWHFWDEYAIQEKVMKGYWDPANPVTIDNDSVKATCYQGKKASIIAVANFGNTDQACRVQVNFRDLGYDRTACTFRIPEIPGFQSERQLEDLDHLMVPAGKGYLIIVRRKD